MMNANFISLYDEVDERFYYYVEKLLGVQVKFLTDNNKDEEDASGGGSPNGQSSLSTM